MECVSCNTTHAGNNHPARQDKPHTFFMHEMAVCPQCSMTLESRVVLRDGAVVRLMHCNQCGPSEQDVAPDAAAYVAAFVARGNAATGQSGDHYLKQTTSTCPGCLKLLTAQVIIRDDKVYFSKDCPQCGPSEALVSEDAKYYVDAYSYARAGTEPLVFATPVEQGCPTDCGTCGDHEQHTCLPIIEITDYCNLECPVCIVNNQNANHITNEAFTKIINTLVKNEGQLESVAFSGGEPTSHPRLLELIDIATREEIGRIVIITNGLRLGKDRAFAQKLKEKGVYIGLQFDGFTADTHEKIRGRDLCSEKAAALKMIKELDLPTQIIFVAARGINEHQIGQVVELFLSEDHFLSLNFQPVALTGAGGGQFAHDPMDRLTIPGVIRAIEEQTGGKLKTSDFAPLPCSHPQCVSLSYLLRLNDGSYMPFGRFVDFKTHGTLLRSSATLGASPEIQDALSDVIHELFANQYEIERADEILAALRRAIDVMFPNRPVSAKEAIMLGEKQAKSIFLHHYMDRHDFDLERLRKCCHHYPQVDGRIMPACGFNMFHRGAAQGPDTALPAWGKKPWTTDAPVQIVHFQRTDTRQALTGIGVDEVPARPPHSIGLPGHTAKVGAKEEQ